MSHVAPCRSSRAQASHVLPSDWTVSETQTVLQASPPRALRLPTTHTHSLEEKGRTAMTEGSSALSPSSGPFSARLGSQGLRTPSRMRQPCPLPPLPTNKVSTHGYAASSVRWFV